VFLWGRVKGFIGAGSGVVFPHGLDDVGRNCAQINLGVSHETSQFACDSIERGWRQAPVRGRHRVEVRDKKGRSLYATLEVKFQRMTVRPPIGKQKRYPALSLTVIHAREIGAPMALPSTYRQSVNKCLSS